MPVGPPPCKGEGSGGGESRARRPAAMQGAWRPYVRHRRCAGVAVSAAVVAAAAKRPRSVATGIARSKRTASLICRWVLEGSLAGFVDRRRDRPRIVRTCCVQFCGYRAGYLGLGAAQL